MEYRIIKSPSPGTLAMILRRKGSPPTVPLERYDSIGLVQGRLIDMVFAADIAEKAADVVIEDIRGHCPQNFTLLAIFGDTAAVEAAVAAIRMSDRAGKSGDVQC